MECKVGTSCSALPSNMLSEGNKIDGTASVSDCLPSHIDIAVNVACCGARHACGCALQLLSTLLLGWVLTVEASRCKVTCGEMQADLFNYCTAALKTPNSQHAKDS